MAICSIQQNHGSYFFRIEQGKLQSNLNPHAVAYEQGSRPVAHNFFQNDCSIFCMVAHIDRSGTFGIIRFEKSTVVPANKDRTRTPKLGNGSTCATPRWHSFLTQRVAEQHDFGILNCSATTILWSHDCLVIVYHHSISGRDSASVCIRWQGLPSDDVIFSLEESEN